MPRALGVQCSECDRPARDRGLCYRCYRAHKQAGTLPPLCFTLNQGKTCAYPDGCDEPAVVRGCCPKHHMRLLRAGELPGQGICTFPGCGRPATTRGLCHGHYEQSRRGRGLAPIVSRGRPVEERLLERREIDAVTGCWNWTGAVDRKGYGHINLGGRGGHSPGCHRVAFALWVGEPGHETVHHKCANPRCFNPEHLELASHRQNVGEMLSRRALLRRIAALEAEVDEFRAQAAP